MTSFAPMRGTTAQPSVPPLLKRPLHVQAMMRQYRVLESNQCTDARMRLANIRRLIAAAEGEYRASMRELDSLNREGRLWMAVDFIHKTALASLDMAASLMTLTGQREADLGRMIADGTQTTSDAIGIGFNVIQGGGSTKEALRTGAARILTHTKAGGAGGAYAKGTADLALTGWSNIDNLIAANGTPAQRSRSAEAGVDAVAGLIQRTADTMATAPGADKARLGKVSAVAGLARSVASYNREVEGVFNRRLEIKSGLDNSRAVLTAAMQRNILHFRKQTEEITAILASCE